MNTERGPWSLGIMVLLLACSAPIEPTGSRTTSDGGHAGAAGSGAGQGGSGGAAGQGPGGQGGDGGHGLSGISGQSGAGGGASGQSGKGAGQGGGGTGAGGEGSAGKAGEGPGGAGGEGQAGDGQGGNAGSAGDAGKAGGASGGGAGSQGGVGAQSGASGQSGSAGQSGGGAAGAQAGGGSTCGNGALDDGESCDGSLLGGETCATVLGKPAAKGKLGCSPGCAFDMSGCQHCGNGTIDPGEACDGEAMGGQTCGSLIPSATGALGCSKYCQFVTATCSPQGVFGNMSALQAGAPWPMDRHDPYLTSRSPVGSPGSLSLRWSDPVLVSSLGVAIDKDGGIYFGSDKTLRAWTKEKAEKWSFDTLGGIWSVPLIRADGSIVFGSFDRFVYALDSSGKLLWQTNVGSLVHRVTIAGDGTIYATVDSGHLVALTPEGNEKWRYPYAQQEDWIAGVMPAVAADGTIYVSPGRLDAGVTALTPDGKKKWNYTIAGADYVIHSGLDAAGAVVVRTGKGKDFQLRLLDPEDGTPKWSRPLPLPSSDHALGPDGTIYVSYAAFDTPDTLMALKGDNSKILWTAPGAAPYRGGPVLGGDGVLLVRNEKAISDGFKLLSPQDTSLLASSPATPNLMTPAAVDSDGVVYVPSQQGLYAFGP